MEMNYTQCKPIFTKVFSLFMEILRFKNAVLWVNKLVRNQPWCGWWKFNLILVHPDQQIVMLNYAILVVDKYF